MLNVLLEQLGDCSIRVSQTCTPLADISSDNGYIMSDNITMLLPNFITLQPSKNPYVKGGPQPPITSPYSELQLAIEGCGSIVLSSSYSATNYITTCCSYHKEFLDLKTCTVEGFWGGLDPYNRTLICNASMRMHCIPELNQQ